MELKEIKGRINISYLIIIVSLLVFNIYHVFFVKTLLLDDQAFYIEAIQNTFPFWPESVRTIFSGYSSFLFFIPLFELNVINPDISRFLLLALGMIPISIILYWAFNKIFELPEWAALGAALIPNILPNDVLMLTFVNGSYTLIAMILILISLYFYYHAITVGHAFRNLILSGIFYYFSILNGEQSVFFLPSIILFHFLIRHVYKDKAKHVYVLHFIFIAGFRVLMSLLHPRMTYGSGFQSIDVIKERIIYAFDQTTPYLHILNAFGLKVSGSHYAFGLLIFILTGLVLYLVGGNEKVNERRDFYKKMLIITIFSAWVVTCSFPFIFIAKFNPSRYYHAASFGINILIMIAMLGISRNLQRIFKEKHKSVMITLSIIIILMSGYFKITNAKSYFSKSNETVNVITRLINSDRLEKNAQVIILGKVNVLTGGYRIWSTGYLRNIFHRNDIDGVLPNEINFYDPFNLTLGGYNTIMSGLDISKPLYVFKIYQERTEYTLKYYKYVLQWFGYNEDMIQKKIAPPGFIEVMKKTDDTWNLYTIDQTTGKAEIILRGKGKASYIAGLNKLKIDSIDVAFGYLGSK